MPKKQKYDAESIKSVSPLEFTRMRPDTYLGSNEYSTQLVKEIFWNALDEHTSGRGNVINISIDTKKNLYKIEDSGQGFPINTIRPEDGKTILQAAYEVMNTSGKFDEDGCYSGSVGLFGIGGKLTNFLSLKFEALTFNEGGYEHLWFKDGVFQKREVGEWTEGTTGTIITWTPDPQFFQDVRASKVELERLFTEVCALCPNLTINFVYDGNETVYHCENGIDELIDKKVQGKEILSNRFSLRKNANDDLIDITLTYTTDYSENITAYVNYGLTESGVHITTIKSALTKQLNKYAQDNNLLKKGQDTFSGTELFEGLVLVFNLKTPTKFDGQTKVRVVDLDRTLITTVINNDFADWLNRNPKDARLILDRAINARKVKEAVQKAKDTARGLKSKKNTKTVDLPSKLVDANPKDRDRSKCVLYCVEGDSAANGLISKRNGEIHGIMPLRGKILSVCKASLADLMKNQEIRNIVKALGLDLNESDFTLQYNPKKLRYHKIVLLEDGDPDGSHIRMLLIALFWKICPDLFIHGHIYTSRPPLYKVTDKNNNYYYLVDDNALTNYKAQHKKERFTINRLKGLGEMSPDELYECMIKNEEETVMQLSISDVEQTDKEIEIFMGSKVAERRAYYEAHFNDVETAIE